MTREPVHNSAMTKADTCCDFVTPKIVQAGWSDTPFAIGEQRTFTNGRSASPGTADRNRTLSLGSLGKIEVPLPPLDAQQAFNQLQLQVATLKAKHTAIRLANAALLPAALERVFAESPAAAS